jgi:hypothetical protein
MTTLFDSAIRVKPVHRFSARELAATLNAECGRPARRRVRRPFAAGLNARPERRTPYTAADLAWAAANLNASTTQYEVDAPGHAAMEQAAGCALAQARLDAGYRVF